MQNFMNGGTYDHCPNDGASGMIGYSIKGNGERDITGTTQENHEKRVGERKDFSTPCPYANRGD